MIKSAIHAANAGLEQSQFESKDRSAATGFIAYLLQ